MSDGVEETGWRAWRWLRLARCKPHRKCRTAAIEETRTQSSPDRRPSTSKLALEDYEPRSMLHVPETKVPRARFPVIDFHTHLSWSARRGQITEAHNNATPEEVLPVIDRKNLRPMVNLTGGYGKVLEQTIDYWQKPHPDRFVVFTEPWFEKINEPGYPQFQADQIGRARDIGAKGLKVWKTLGLYLREHVTTGPLVKIDDRRFDPMREAAGAHRMPVAIHPSDPEAFFLPTDRFNERYEELSAHPDWSFHGKDFPATRVARGAEPGDRLAIQKLSSLSCILAMPKICLTSLNCWIGIRICMWRLVHVSANSGDNRGPRASFLTSTRTAFCSAQIRYRGGNDNATVDFGEQLYEIYYRFLETEDEYFDYAPAPKPPQGRWRIYGIGLPESDFT